MILAWTEEDVARLIALHKRGLSAKQIADEMGGLTRNAVLGKIHRMGLSKPRVARDILRVSSRPRARRKKAARIREKALGKLPTDEPVMLPPEPISRPPVALLDLRDEHCRYPIGNPGEEDFGFCGAPRRDVCPYCAHHARIDYRVPRNITEEERERRRQLGKSQIASGAWSCGFATRGDV